MKNKSIFLMFGLFVILISLTACEGQAAQSEDPIEGTSWRLLFYRKSTVLEGTEITADFKDGQVTGSAGCNSYFSSYQMNGLNLTTSQIGVTEMYCGEPEGIWDQEVFFLEALNDAQRFELTEGKLMIFRSDGEALTFEPND